MKRVGVTFEAEVSSWIGGWHCRKSGHSVDLPARVKVKSGDRVKVTIEKLPVKKGGK